MTETALSGGEFAGMKPTHWLDMRGQTCPTPTTETLAALEQMVSGEVLEVESDYYPARSTIPFLCQQRGYSYAFEDDPAVPSQPIWRIRIRKP